MKINVTHAEYEALLNLGMRVDFMSGSREQREEEWTRGVRELLGPLPILPPEPYALVVVRAETLPPWPAAEREA